MSSLLQYLDLYRQHGDTICAGSAPSLNAMRPAAMDALKGAHLPTRATEGYQTTSIDQMMAPDFGLNLGRLSLPVDVSASFHCGVPNLSTLMGIVVNDSFHPVGQLQQRLPQGVIFGSLAEIAKSRPELVEPYYGRIANLNDAPTALNTLLAQDGVMLHISRGVKLDKPLQLVNIFSSPTPLMAMRRLLIVVEEGASAQLLCCDHTQDSTQSYFASQVTEIRLAPGAHFDLYDLEESSPSTSRCAQLYAIQGEGSSLVINGTTLSCGTTRNDYFIDQTAPHCSTLLAGMAIGSDSQHIDNHTSIHHHASHGHSRQLFKYVLDDQASGAFQGEILVDEGAVKTEACQSDRNLLASRGALMHTKPQLLIYCDDVKCSHGATTGQLDQEALFYMRSRGISEKTARTMLMQAFMADVIDTVGMDGLRERLHMLVEKRLLGQKTLCGDCSASCSSAKS